jgi:hypothetical protein
MRFISSANVAPASTFSVLPVLAKIMEPGTPTTPPGCPNVVWSGKVSR